MQDAVSCVGLTSRSNGLFAERLFLPHQQSATPQQHRQKPAHYPDDAVTVAHWSDHKATYITATCSCRCKLALSCRAESAVITVCSFFPC